jgi:hypothetical protein
MFEFGLNEDEVNTIIEPKIEKYKLDNNYKGDINDLKKEKIENKKNKLSDGKISYNDLINIIEKYNNDINIKKKEDIKKEEKYQANKEKNSNIENGKNKINNNWEIVD